MVQRMLSNPFYAGFITLKGEIVARGTHEPIIDESTWSAVQERLARHAVIRHRSPNDASSWLEGLVQHSCGSRMHLTVIRKGGRAYPNFVCARSAGVNRCGQPQVVIAQGKLETLVRAKLAEDFGRVVSVEDAVARAESMAGGDDAENARKALDQRLAKLERRHARARELWLEGGDSLEQWKDAKAAYDLERSQIDAEIAALPSAPDPDRYRLAAANLTSIAPIIELASGEALRTILERVGVAVVSKDAVTIQYRPPFADFMA
jgi:hypothetical protein